MANEHEEFDPYHVPQQLRRDKLRLLHYSNSSSHFLPGPLPDCLTRLAAAATLSVKEEDDFITTTTVATADCSNSSNLIYMMMDPRSSSSSSTNNPNSSFQEIEQFNNNPFHLYNNPQNLRFFNACHNHHGGLSLSLSTISQQQQQQQQQNQIPLELNLQNDYNGKIASFGVSGGGCSSEMSRNLLVPLGPFTGYASVLKGSRFLRPAEKLLEEICEGIMYVEKMSVNDHMASATMEYDVAATRNALVLDDDVVSQSCNLGRNKSRLMSMLNEVYKRYKQYCHQMQAVVSSFESVAGVKNAAPFASMALKSMSKHFSCLRNAISDQLQFLSVPPPHDNSNNNGAPSHVAQEKDTISPPGFDTAAAAATGMLEFVQHQPVWRPQRGLPERAVTILRAWLFDHFLHPYPTDTDKLMLAKQTGLSRSQVSNWFINARVRLWKPMVEEIHMLETRQAQISSNEMADKEKDHLIPDSSTSRIQDVSLKRARKETTTSVMENAMDRNYMDELSSVPRLGLGGGRGSGGVSLTLGLEQNNGITADPFSLSAARRLGLVDPNGEEYHVGGGGGVWH